MIAVEVYCKLNDCERDSVDCVVRNSNDVAGCEQGAGSKKRQAISVMTPRFEFKILNISKKLTTQKHNTKPTKANQ